MNAIIREKQDLTHLSWARMRQSSGTAGSFLKSYESAAGKKIYYKLSDFSSTDGVVGHECVNEVIVDRLLTKLAISHLSYRLIHADVKIDGKIYETWLNASEDFKEFGETKASFEDFFQLERAGNETPLVFCKRFGWEESVYEMLITDFLILNRDRHGANVEVLRNPRRRTVRLAPLFDHGLSFVCRCRTEEELAEFDGMKDRRVQAFFGSNSTLENLKTVPKAAMRKLPRLTERDRENIFDGLDEVLPQPFLDKIWQMLWERWEYFEDLRHS